MKNIVNLKIHSENQAMSTAPNQSKIINLKVNKNNFIN